MRIILTLLLFSLTMPTWAQEEARVVWQVTNFDINATIQEPERLLNVVANVSARNVGRAAGSTFTFRINNKANVKSVSINNAAANIRPSPETRGNLQRIAVKLPTSITPDGSVTLTINYSLPVETNSGLAAISAAGSQFLPLSFWYPSPNTPFSIRGGDTAPFRLTVNGSQTISSGVEKSSGVYEQRLNSQPFFVQGDWDKMEGVGDAKGIFVFGPKGGSADERKQAEAIIALAAAARAFYTSTLGPFPDTPINLVAVRRGSGFNEAGTVLL